jgi:1-deoxy-D-xylulose-5-phosphate synthase
LDRAGLVGEDGATHHGVFDLAYLRCIPNLIVYSPRNETDLQNILYTAQLGLEHPIAIRYPRGRGQNTHWKIPYETITIGEAHCIKEGTKVAVLSNGTIGNNVTQALENLNHPSAFAHFDVPFVKPLDESLLHTIFSKFEMVITIEDGTVTGGFGSAILEFAAANNYHSKLQLLGVPEEFIEQGTILELQQYCKIDVSSLQILFKGML